MGTLEQGQNTTRSVAGVSKQGIRTPRSLDVWEVSKVSLRLPIHIIDNEACQAAHAPLCICLPAHCLARTATAPCLVRTATAPQLARTATASRLPVPEVMSDQ